MITYPTPDEIARDVFDRFIDTKRVVNMFRTNHVEAMVKRALGESYKLTNGWDGWDLEHKASGWRLEVKQAAARQSWEQPKEKKAPTFDIAPRQWRYDGATPIKLDAPQRLAHAYVCKRRANPTLPA